MIIRKRDFSEYAIRTGIWNRLCEFACADPECHNEIEITGADVVRSNESDYEPELNSMAGRAN